MKKTALITGASGGLGREFAKLFARDGYELALVAQNGEKLAALQRELQRGGARVQTIAQDLSARDAAQTVFNQLGQTPDVLVNNAGFGDFGPYAACDWAKQYEMVQVNVTALIQLTRCCLPGMLERGSGKILNVASIAAFEPGPLMAVYYATKAFVLSFSEALYVELKGSGVSVTALCPGPTKTGFEAKAALGASGLFKNLKNDEAEDVAAFGYQSMLRGKVIAIPGAGNRLITVGAKLAPRSLTRACVYRVQKEKTAR